MESELLSKDRREALQILGRSLGYMMMANSAIYVIGHATKVKDGSIVAGAKCGAPTRPVCFSPRKTFCCPGPNSPVDDFWTPCMLQTPC